MGPKWQALELSSPSTVICSYNFWADFGKVLKVPFGMRAGNSEEEAGSAHWHAGQPGAGSRYIQALKRYVNR
jgi:hypothetical protein